jgi:hypothetical protein
VGGFLFNSLVDCLFQDGVFLDEGGQALESVLGFDMVRTGQGCESNSAVEDCEGFIGGHYGSVTEEPAATKSGIQMTSGVVSAPSPPIRIPIMNCVVVAPLGAVKVACPAVVDK